ncbi:hypothetical protein HYDPIDRAFT_119234 [Hydnomerulius pinastri MD-312]|uniref:Uncharacterized protein n=1 Tax=Hydnomerulius pinastri MD-312 TaxID=994086 RepID=A0A0C9VZ86_9AGAM|nr:hypothetical protein HYDPIDRAFT_119234 [Hydnomerulius pinastri MD-312]
MGRTRLRHGGGPFRVSASDLLVQVNLHHSRLLYVRCMYAKHSDVAWWLTTAPQNSPWLLLPSNFNFQALRPQHETSRTCQSPGENRTSVFSSEFSSQVKAFLQNSPHASPTNSCWTGRGSGAGNAQLHLATSLFAYARQWPFQFEMGLQLLRLNVM